jgi:hypothetical protein
MKKVILAVLALLAFGASVSYANPGAGNGYGLAARR